jgi:hypothetical protein
MPQEASRTPTMLKKKAQLPPIPNEQISQNKQFKINERKMIITVDLPNGDKKSICGFDKDAKVSTLKNEITNQYDIDFEKHDLYYNYLTLNKLMDDKKLSDFIDFVDYSTVKAREKSKNHHFIFYHFILNHILMKSQYYVVGTE